MNQFFILIFLMQLSVFSAEAQKCEKVYDFSASENIDFYNLEELVVINSDGYVGLYLDGSVFRSKKFNSWNQVHQFYSNLKLSDRRVLSKISLTRQGSFASLLNNLFSLVKIQNADLTYRFKSIDSLRDKILDRVETFERKEKSYTLTDLADVVGFRIAVPLGSPLLKYASKSSWAKALDISENQVLDVEIKGTSVDFENGRYYSAIHLNIFGRDGQNFEIQIMTKAMAIWHKWDHTNVYKSKNSDQKKVEKLKQYSMAWVKIINEVTRASDGQAAKSYFVSLLKSLGLSSTSTLLDLDLKLKKKLNMKDSEGFDNTSLNNLAHEFGF